MGLLLNLQLVSMLGQLLAFLNLLLLGIEL
jgi:hypothetical protein